MSRNEAARARHRQLLKQQFSSLGSLPLVEGSKQNYHLQNHFGWHVLQKCRIGDGTFPPYLLTCIYCDKPDVPPGYQDGGDRDKIMYVLYIRGKEGLEPVDAKQTQTSVATVLSRIIESAPPPKKPKEGKGKKRRADPHRRRVIGDFYYIPIKERLDMKYGIGQEGAEGDIGTIGGGRGKHGEKGRSKPKGWQLRAGAEYPEIPEEDEDLTDAESDQFCSDSEDDSEDRATVTSFLENLRKYDCTDCFSKNNNEELMETPAEKNKYLYLPRERYEKRHHVGDHSSYEKRHHIGDHSPSVSTN